MKNESFAILITTYNGSKFVGDLIKSVQIAIGDLGVKVFVNDDCSSDNTIEIIQQNWVIDQDLLKINRNESNLGLFKNKNSALKMLENDFDWVFLIHQDDLVSENWVSRIISEINNTDASNVLVIWSSYKQIRENEKDVFISEGETSGIATKIKLDNESIEHYICSIYTPYCVSGSVINTKLASKIGYFNDWYHHFGDTDFIVRGMLAGFTHVYIASPLITRRFSNLQASVKHKNSARDIFEMRKFYKTHSYFLNFKSRMFLKFFMVFKSTRRTLHFLVKGKYKFALKIFSEGIYILIGI